jgi:hypothetical protein
MERGIKRMQIGIGFWFLWALSSAVGWMVAFPIRGDLLWPPGWLVAGVVSGTLQSLLLRLCKARTGLWQWWILASIVGWVLAWLTIGAATDDMADLVVLELMIAASVPVGVLQWLVLRRHLAVPVSWTVVNPLSIGVGIAVVIWIGRIVGHVDDTMIELVIGALFGIVPGAITASVLLWPLRKAFSGMPNLANGSIVLYDRKQQGE